LHLINTLRALQKLHHIALHGRFLLSKQIQTGSAVEPAPELYEGRAANALEIEVQMRRKLPPTAVIDAIATTLTSAVIKAYSTKSCPSSSCHILRRKFISFLQDFVLKEVSLWIKAL